MFPLMLENIQGVILKFMIVLKCFQEIETEDEMCFNKEKQKD